MINIKSIAETLVSLSVKDLNNLSTILKEEYGIEQNLYDTHKGTYNMEEQTEKKNDKSTLVNVIMKSHGKSKLATIKKIKEITGLGLKESKELVDSLPKIIKENIYKEEANKIKTKLEQVGAEVELK